MTVTEVVWTWMSGSSTSLALGVYGTQGAPAAANAPGARSGSVSWIDSAGKLWLFGGGGCGIGCPLPRGQLNDLWKYDTVSGQWTWVKGSVTYNAAGVYGTQGVPAAANVPGAREGSVSWTDSAGKLWLFGGVGNDGNGDEGYLNDLWKYDPLSGQWAWMSGSSTRFAVGVYGTQGVPAAGNVPSPRQQSVSWTDGAGKLWLFGGEGLNDLWKYDSVSGQWTWMSGSSNAVNAAGVYGTQGSPAAANVPASRYGAVSWTDSAGKLWLFGGFRYGASINAVLNDLWKYDLVSGLWTFMSGSSTPNAVSVYGTPGTPAAANVPGARVRSVTWTDSADKLWLFGGTSGDGGNDLWKYDPISGQWTWMSGSSTANAAGVYGAQGAPGGSNVPGARSGSVSWTDSAGKHWLFGGVGSDCCGSRDYLSDLWQWLPQ
jgi:N-acetylneuraminic acid mutarotase